MSGKLFLECNMGAAGDMLMAALLELHEDPAGFLTALKALDIPGVEIRTARVSKCGILGTQVSVSVNGCEEKSDDVVAQPHGACGHDHSHGHDHGHMHDHAHHAHEGHSHRHGSVADVRRIVSGLSVSERVKADALAVYDLIAEAESRAHGVPVTEVHFHEVGALDAVVDIVGVCMLIEALAPAEISASPVHVGSGQVRCAHGVLPVPTPATAHILRGIPTYSDGTQGELCTPTGAALLRHFAARFENMPQMRTTRIGYGMGHKDFAVANCLRAFWGEAERAAEDVWEFSCNLDDMTPEAVAFAQQRLMEAGALDVWTQAIGMKKGRLGVLLCCLCRADERERFAALLFRYTTTLGLRGRHCSRFVLDREISECRTPCGTLRVKRASGYGVARAKAEYEDVARIAREKDIAFFDVPAD